MSKEVLFSKVNLKEPIYFYKVNEFVASFEKDKNELSSLEHIEVFKGGDIKKNRADAVKYYNERLNGMRDAKFFLPFAAPEDFVFGENSAFSVAVIFVEYYNEGYYIDYIIMGDDDETTKESLEIEAQIINEL